MLYDWIDGEMPLILTFWHGQHFLTPFVPKPHHKAKVMISRSFDADVNAIAAEALGIGTIRGSGTHRKNFHEKGGVAATRQMIEALVAGNQRRDDRGRAEDFAARGPRHRQHRKTFRTSDLSGGDRDQQPHHHEAKLGQVEPASAVRPHGDRVAEAPVHRAADADNETLERARQGSRSQTQSRHR
jgi:hypothetical protein